MGPEVSLIFTCVICLVIRLRNICFVFILFYPTDIKHTGHLAISVSCFFSSDSCQYFTSKFNDKLSQRGVSIKAGVTDMQTSPLQIFTKAELSLLTGARTKFNELKEEDSEFLERKDGSGHIIVLGRNVSKAIDKDNIEWMLLKTLQKLMVSRKPSS